MLDFEILRGISALSDPMVENFMRKIQISRLEAVKKDIFRSMTSSQEW